jgi:flagellar M-ring protein FliF
MLGDGGFRAEVSADIDFTAIERTQELYNPETAAIRSEQVHEESAGDSKSVGGIPGALSNQPNSANGENNADIKNNQRTTQATRNYELDRTISYTRQQVGKITRLTVAVAVNDRREVSAEGQTSYVQWSEEELARIQQLVSNAVGFDSSRGDVVNVINKRFVEFETVSQEEPAFYETEWFNKYVKLGVSVLIVAILILGVLRPLFKNLTSAPKSSNDGTAITEFNGLEMMDSGGFGDSKVTLSGGDRALLPNPNESYEQQLLAIRGLVAEDSGRVAQVIKQWIAEDE